jgi:hypothetical protein
MDELTREEHEDVVQARRALVQTINRAYPPRRANALSVVAAVGLFVDICKTSVGKAELLDVVNDQLRELGLQLTPTARH